MRDKLKKIKVDFGEDLKKVSSAKHLEELENKYLSRSRGLLTGVLRGLKKIPEASRPVIGQQANEIKQWLIAEITKKGKSLKTPSRNEVVDVTAPGKRYPTGHLHLVTQAIRDIEEIFARIGFQRHRGPEVEWDWYAFEALNMPSDHPARDEWETFFIDRSPVGPKGQRILTPHATSIDVRLLEQKKLPLRSINIAKCYRRQSDVSHAPMFHQFDGLLIDKHVTVANLKGVLDYFVKSFFGPKRKARIRPYTFKFTEPSFEVDVSCGICNGRGCRLCKEGWLELGGAGMLHPNVMKAGGINPKKYSALAFGWGVERVYMMKEGLSLPDIRLLYSNDLRILQQF
ncbi:phenylalanine--tRNA ligase subunit alpha [bacterium]|nr:phenylalanine--tRNA ligase subunit alpha [bacterium]